MFSFDNGKARPTCKMLSLKKKFIDMWDATVALNQQIRSLEDKAVIYCLPLALSWVYSLRVKQEKRNSVIYDFKADCSQLWSIQDCPVLSLQVGFRRPLFHTVATVCQSSLYAVAHENNLLSRKDRLAVRCLHDRKVYLNFNDAELTGEIIECINEYHSDLTCYAMETSCDLGEFMEDDSAILISPAFLLPAQSPNYAICQIEDLPCLALYACMNQFAGCLMEYVELYEWMMQCFTLHASK